jgi:hypothetical protein
MLKILTAVLTLSALNLRADVYTDTAGDLNDGTTGGDNLAGFTHLDIKSVEVTNTISHLVFKINLTGNPQAVNWGKYAIGIDTNTATGDISANGNGWGRKITMAPRGMDYWVASWVDGGGGAELYAFDGAAWLKLPTGPSVSTTTNSATIRFPFASLNKVFGDTVDFDVYTTGGGTDPAVDALNNPAVAVKGWADFYTNNNVSTYTLQTVTAIPHTVSFSVDMGVPIWEFGQDSQTGFDPQTDKAIVRGTFNDWTGESFELIRAGTSTIYTNTFTFDAEPGGAIEYKFFGFSFPGYENPVLLNGANRSLTLTNTTMEAPLVCFGDRCLTDPAETVVEFNVDMSFQRTYGEFDPDAGDTVSIRGPFESWDAPGLPLTAGIDPLTNIYSATKSFFYYPTGAVISFPYKANIQSVSGTARNSGWENPVSTGNQNRTFALISTNLVLDFAFNDETGVFSIDRIEQTDPDSVVLRFKAYGDGIYDILARPSLLANPTAIGSVTNTSNASGDVSYTVQGISNFAQQFFQAEFKGFNKPPPAVAAP